MVLYVIIILNVNNTEGSFMCVCQEGFDGDGFNCTGNENETVSHETCIILQYACSGRSRLTLKVGILGCVPHPKMHVVLMWYVHDL